MRFVIIFLSPELCPLCDAVAGVEDAWSGTTITVAVALEAEKLLEELGEAVAEAGASPPLDGASVALGEELGEFSFVVDALGISAVAVAMTLLGRLHSEKITKNKN